MSGATPRLGLKTFDSSDPFLRQDFNDNNGKLDQYPGAFLCTSNSRPAWGPAQAGMRIFETDTRREMMWSGTSWREVLSTAPVWPGFVRPEASIGNDTHLYYRMSSFTVNRPGTLAIVLEVEWSCQSIYVMNVHLTPQVDGSDVMVGSTRSFMRCEKVHFSGGGYQRSYMMGALGLQPVGPGSHNVGVHFNTRPESSSDDGIVRFVSARSLAILTNSEDT